MFNLNVLQKNNLHTCLFSLCGKIALQQNLSLIATAECKLGRLSHTLLHLKNDFMALASKTTLPSGPYCHVVLAFQFKSNQTLVRCAVINKPNFIFVECLKQFKCNLKCVTRQLLQDFRDECTLEKSFIIIIIS